MNVCRLNPTFFPLLISRFLLFFFFWTYKSESEKRAKLGCGKPGWPWGATRRESSSLHFAAPATVAPTSDGDDRGACTAEDVLTHIVSWIQTVFVPFYHVKKIGIYLLPRYLQILTLGCQKEVSIRAFIISRKKVKSNSESQKFSSRYSWG